MGIFNKETEEAFENIRKATKQFRLKTKELEIHNVNLYDSEQVQRKILSNLIEIKYLLRDLTERQDADRK